MATITIDLVSFGRGAVMVVFVVVIVGIIVMLYKKIRGFFLSRAFDGFDRQQFARRWKEIEELTDGGEVKRKLAIIEADKLLDHALKALAFPGESLGDRLKFAGYKYPKIKDVWWAHKVRNQLVHEASYHLDAGVAKKALRQFKRSLQDLGAI